MIREIRGITEVMRTVHQKVLSRRRYLFVRVIAGGCPSSLAAKAVATTALAHPEWDMEELRPWSEWDEEYS